MHHISYVQVEYPVVLLFHSQYCLHVVLQGGKVSVEFRLSMFALGVVVGGLIELS